MSIDELIVRCELNAICEAEKDLLFSGCKPLAKLSDDNKTVICQALKHYAATAANRTVRFLAKEKLLRE